MEKTYWMQILLLGLLCFHTAHSIPEDDYTGKFLKPKRKPHCNKPQHLEETDEGTYEIISKEELEENAFIKYRKAIKSFLCWTQLTTTRFDDTGKVLQRSIKYGLSIETINVFIGNHLNSTQNDNTKPDNNPPPIVKKVNGETVIEERAVTCKHKYKILELDDTLEKQKVDVWIKPEKSNQRILNPLLPGGGDDCEDDSLEGSTSLATSQYSAVSDEIGKDLKDIICGSPDGQVYPPISPNEIPVLFVENQMETYQENHCHTVSKNILAVTCPGLSTERLPAIDEKFFPSDIEILQIGPVPERVPKSFILTKGRTNCFLLSQLRQIPCSKVPDIKAATSKIILDYSYFDKEYDNQKSKTESTTRTTTDKITRTEKTVETTTPTQSTAEITSSTILPNYSYFDTEHDGQEGTTEPTTRTSTDTKTWTENPIETTPVMQSMTEVTSSTILSEYSYFDKEYNDQEGITESTSQITTDKTTKTHKTVETTPLTESTTEVKTSTIIPNYSYLDRQQDDQEGATKSTTQITTDETTRVEKTVETTPPAELATEFTSSTILPDYSYFDREHDHQEGATESTTQTTTEKTTRTEGTVERTPSTESTAKVPTSTILSDPSYLTVNINDLESFSKPVCYWVERIVEHYECLESSKDYKNRIVSGNALRRAQLVYSIPVLQEQYIVASQENHCYYFKIVKPVVCQNDDVEDLIILEKVRGKLSTTVSPTATETPTTTPIFTSSTAAVEAEFVFQLVVHEESGISTSCITIKQRYYQTECPEDFPILYYFDDNLLPEPPQEIPDNAINPNLIRSDKFILAKGEEKCFLFEKGTTNNCKDVEENLSSGSQEEEDEKDITTKHTTIESSDSTAQILDVKDFLIPSHVFANDMVLLLIDYQQNGKLQSCKRIRKGYYEVNCTAFVRNAYQLDELLLETEPHSFQINQVVPFSTKVNDFRNTNKYIWARGQSKCFLFQIFEAVNCNEVKEHMVSLSRRPMIENGFTDTTPVLSTIATLPIMPLTSSHNINDPDPHTSPVILFEVSKNESSNIRCVSVSSEIIQLPCPKTSTYLFLIENIPEDMKVVPASEVTAFASNQSFFARNGNLCYKFYEKDGPSCDLNLRSALTLYKLHPDSKIKSKYILLKIFQRAMKKFTAKNEGIRTTGTPDSLQIIDNIVENQRETTLLDWLSITAESFTDELGMQSTTVSPGSDQVKDDDVIVQSMDFTRPQNLDVKCVRVEKIVLNIKCPKRKDSLYKVGEEVALPDVLREVKVNEVPSSLRHSALFVDAITQCFIFLPIQEVDCKVYSRRALNVIRYYNSTNYPFEEEESFNEFEEDQSSMLPSTIPAIPLAQGTVHWLHIFKPIVPEQNSSLNWTNQSTQLLPMSLYYFDKNGNAKRDCLLVNTTIFSLPCPPKNISAYELFEDKFPVNVQIVLLRKIPKFFFGTFIFARGDKSCYLFRKQNGTTCFHYNQSGIDLFKWPSNAAAPLQIAAKHIPEVLEAQDANQQFFVRMYTIHQSSVFAPECKLVYKPVIKIKCPVNTKQFYYLNETYLMNFSALATFDNIGTSLKINNIILGRSKTYCYVFRIAKDAACPSRQDDALDLLSHDANSSSPFVIKKIYGDKYPIVQYNKEGINRSNIGFLVKIHDSLNNTSTCRVVENNVIKIKCPKSTTNLYTSNKLVLPKHTNVLQQDSTQGLINSHNIVVSFQGECYVFDSISEITCPTAMELTELIKDYPRTWHTDFVPLSRKSLRSTANQYGKGRESISSKPSHQSSYQDDRYTKASVLDRTTSYEVIVGSTSPTLEELTGRNISARRTAPHSTPSCSDVLIFKVDYKGIIPNYESYLYASKIAMKVSCSLVSPLYFNLNEDELERKVLFVFYDNKHPSNELIVKGKYDCYVFEQYINLFCPNLFKEAIPLSRDTFSEVLTGRSVSARRTAPHSSPSCSDVLIFKVDYKGFIPNYESYLYASKIAMKVSCSLVSPLYFNLNEDDLERKVLFVFYDNKHPRNELIVKGKYDCYVFEQYINLFCPNLFKEAVPLSRDTLSEDKPKVSSFQEDSLPMYRYLEQLSDETILTTSKPTSSIPELIRKQNWVAQRDEMIARSIYKTVPPAPTHVLSSHEGDKNPQLQPTPFSDYLTESNLNQIGPTQKKTLALSPKAHKSLQLKQIDSDSDESPENLWELESSEETEEPLMVKYIFRGKTKCYKIDAHINIERVVCPRNLSRVPRIVNPRLVKMICRRKLDHYHKNLRTKDMLMKYKLLRYDNPNVDK